MGPLMQQVGEVLSTFVNILKGCIGGGIYEYPLLLSVHGIIMALVMTVLSGMASLFGAFIYADINDLVKKGNTISSLANKIFSPRVKYFVDLVVVLKCLVVATGYLALASNMIRIIGPGIKNTISGNEIEIKPSFIIALGCLILTPSIISARIDKLKYLSYVGTFSILYIIFASFLMNRENEIEYFFFPKKFDIMKNLGSFVFSFSCHQGVLLIQNESSLSLKGFKMTITAAFLGAGLLNMLFGFINYSRLSKFGNLENIFAF